MGGCTPGGATRTPPGLGGAHLPQLLLRLPLLLLGTARSREGPRDTAHHGRPPALAGPPGGIASVELEGAEREVDLAPQAGHGVQPVVQQVSLGVEPARSGGGTTTTHTQCHRKARAEGGIPTASPLPTTPLADGGERERFLGWGAQSASSQPSRQLSPQPLCAPPPPIISLGGVQ